jgi:DNA-binding transcriptional regulator YdaS (Cro superfamily)
MTMTLVEYFKTEPHGAKREMADYLGISTTWLSLILSGKRLPSAKLAGALERATQGLVTRQEMRADLFSDSV